MRLAITGSSGFIGSALTRRLLADGHEVVRVIRADSDEPDTLRWDIDRGQMETAAMEGLDGVVHLAGRGIADSRWTESHLREVRESRVRGTDLLARTIAGLERPPAVLLSGSAIGFYGDRGDEVLTEASGPGDDALADICQAWEDATAPAEEVGIRVAHLRTGIVQSPSGGALGKQLLPFKLGLGGRAGRGDQWQPWITLDDHLKAVTFLLDAAVTGPVNLTAPNPVTNVEMAKTLGRVLGRPAVIPIPGLVTKLPGGIGPLAESLLFSSARVHPAKLTEAGFAFDQPTLEPALRHLLDRPA